MKNPYTKEELEQLIAECGQSVPNNPNPRAFYGSVKRARDRFHDRWPKLSATWTEVRLYEALYERPLNKVPLHINDTPELFSIIARWRLRIGK